MIYFSNQRIPLSGQLGKCNMKTFLTAWVLISTGKGKEGVGEGSRRCETLFLVT